MTPGRQALTEMIADPNNSLMNIMGAAVALLINEGDEDEKTFGRYINGHIKAMLNPGNAGRAG